MSVPGLKESTVYTAPGAISPGPAYWVKVWEDVWLNLAGLLAANAIFLVWCAPSGLLLLLGLGPAAALVAPFTLGPGLIGLATYAGRLARGEPGSFWRDSLRGAWTGYGAGAMLGALGIAAVCTPMLALRMAVAGEPTVTGLALLAGQTGALAVAIMVSVHFVSLVGLYGQPLRQALRNAGLLSLRHPGPTGGLVGLGIGALALVGAVGEGLLIVVPGVLAVCVVNRTLLLVRERVAE